MSITGILPTLLLGGIFIVLAVFLWRRNRPRVSAIPFVIGTALIFFGVYVFVNGKNHKQGSEDYQVLVQELGRPDLFAYLSNNPDDPVNLYFASLASQALYVSSEQFPDLRTSAMPHLAELTQWVADTRNFPLWNSTRNWKDNVFFLAHASIILGHYQLVSKDETFARSFRRIGEYLGKKIPNARYKNLISDPQDDIMRPADNAAAIYAVSLHDQYYATEFTEGAIRNWREYLGKELEFAESHLPCSGFTEPNRCKLDPTASPLGMMLGYLAAAGYKDQMLYREWLHYFKDLGFSPLSLSFNSGMRAKNDPRFCDLAAYPLPCESHLSAIGMWVSAEYGGHYTYARLLSSALLTQTSNDTELISLTPPARRIELLTDLAIRVIAEMH